MEVKSPLTTGGMIIAFAVITGIVIGLLFGALGTLVALILIPVVIFLVLYLIWAPHGIFAFFLEEGYAKIIMEGNSFYDMHIKRKGKYLIDNYDVVDEGSIWPRKKLPFTIFGMVPYLWPFRKVYTYNQRWVKFKDGVKEKREEVLDHVIIMPYVYGVEVKDAETEGKVPVDMMIEVETEIFNPYKAMFQIKDWNAAMTSWIEGATRDFVSQNSYEQIIKGELSENFKGHIINKVEKTLEKYGVKINNMAVIQVVPSNIEYEKATQQRIIEERKKEATIVKAEADAQKEAIARMGSALQMVASATGQTVEKLNKELEANPSALHTKYKEQFTVAMDLVNRNMAIDGKAYFEMNMPNNTSGGGTDFSNMLGAIIAANKIIEQQKKEPSKSEDPLSPTPKGEKVYTKQEIDDLIAWGEKQRKQ